MSLLKTKKNWGGEIINELTLPNYFPIIEQ